jgi:pyridoxal 5-phosphate dependent beta-lyase
VSLPHPELARAWRRSRPQARVSHLDHAGCSRQSLQVLGAVAGHTRSEAENGGYQAELAAEEQINAGRAALGSLLGPGAASVFFVESARAGLSALLDRWPASTGETVACAPGEYAANLFKFAQHGLSPRPMPADELGRIAVADLQRWLAAERPQWVHVTHVPSHRGIVQPVAEIGELCRELEIPLVVDVAQSLGQVPTHFDADAIYGTSRKWVAGPRGVGFVGVGSAMIERLRLPDGKDRAAAATRPLESQDAHIAGRLGFAVALSEFVAGGATAAHVRLAAIGRLARQTLAGAGGWGLLEPLDEPTAMVTLQPPAGVSVAATVVRLLAAHQILTAAVPPGRAPWELTGPVLRVSPHLDITAAELSRLAFALCG